MAMLKERLREIKGIWKDSGLAQKAMI